MISFVLCVFVFAAVECFSLRTGTQCGVEASSQLVHHNPWLVLLEYYRHDDLTELRCGGTLIDSNHVLTAAHCVQKHKFTKIVVRLGDYDLATDPDCEGEGCADAVFRIDADIFAHPGYDGKEHDIAILKLKKPAPYTDFIRPICLPSGKLVDKTTFSAAGWGEVSGTGQYSRVKKILPLPLWSLESCQNLYRQSFLPTSIICAGGDEGIDTCRGDSGGPLTWYKERAELWGVTSLGNVRCGTRGTPGIYTKVVDYLDWIQEVVSS